MSPITTRHISISSSNWCLSGVCVVCTNARFISICCTSVRMRVKSLVSAWTSCWSAAGGAWLSRFSFVACGTAISEIPSTQATIPQLLISHLTSVLGTRYLYPHLKIVRCTVAHLCLLILGLSAPARVQSVRFEPVLENRHVSVYSLDLQAGRRAAIFQNTHDIFWIALTPGQVTMSDRDGAPSPVNFRAGDARFFSSFRTSFITNDAGEPFRAVLVEIKRRGLTSSCDCDSAAQAVVCGCARAATLPALWAVGIGSVVVGGTTLASGQAFASAGNRGDTLLVAVSPLTLRDDASPNTSTMNLRAGEAVWIPAGLHKLRNLGATAARYVTLEF
jgi:hypothetical protein